MEFHKALPVFFGVVLVAAFIFGMAFYKNANSITGQVSLDLDSYYQKGEKLNGTLGISLRDGELIPSNSRVIIENGNSTLEYELSELLSGESVQGNFYVEGKSFSGSGQGYGFEGERETNPIVYFTLEVSSSSAVETVSETSTDSSTTDTNVQEESPAEIIVEENATEAISENATQETTGTAEAISAEPELTASETTTEEQSQSAPVESTETAASEPAPETTSTAETPAEQTSDTATAEPSPTTGSVILDFSRGIFNSFLRLTGLVSLDVTSTINGEVSKGSEFVYSLSEGQKASIVPGSVRTSSNVIPDNSISLGVSSTELTVTTDYAETETGFGQDYIGTGENVLSIDLSSLGIVPQDGDLNIRLVYENEEIVSLSTPLIEGAISSETVPTEILNETLANETEAVVPVEASEQTLSDDERQVLIGEFGNATLEVTKAEKTASGYIVRLEIGEFWTERTYSLDYSQTQLEEQVQNDIVLFLKDLARKFSSEQQETGEEIGDLVGRSYEI